MNKSFAFILLIVSISLIVLCSIPCPGDAKTINLSLASFGAPTHCNVRTAIDWSKEIESLTNGEVKIVPYWGGSLLKAGAIYDGVVQGAADIGMDMPTYQKGRFPVSECIELPWGYPNSEVSSQVAYDVLDKFKPKEIEDVHVFYLASMGGAALEGNKPIRTMEDMKGLKVRSTGNTVKIVQALGGVGISMPITETYDALRKNTVDCTLNSLEALMLFKFAEVSKYTTKLPCVGYGSINWIFMSQKKWNSLPADIQKIFEEVSKKYTLINAKAWDKFDAEAIDFAKKHNVEMIDLASHEANKWAQKMKPVRDEYIASMNSRGLPGKEIADYIQERIAYYTK